MNQQQLSEFLDRSCMFQEAMAAHITELAPVDETRYCVAFDAALLSMEHAAAVLILTQGELQASAFALMRVQFESLVRGIWLLYAASDAWIEKLSAPLSAAGAQSANKAPMLKDMLDELVSSERSPKGIVEQLQEYRAVSGSAMNDYTHGGLHPLSRTSAGYPVQLLVDATRNCNAVLAITGQLASILTGDSNNMNPIKKFHVDFSDCLPILKK